MNYILTNIAFDGQRQKVIKDFKLPADINEIHEWLKEYGYVLPDRLAYESFIRARLFNNFELTFDYQKLDIDYNYFRPAAGFYIVDLNDHKYKSYKTVTLSLTLPKSFLATLTESDLYFIETDGIEQAIFENLLTSLPIDIDWD